MVQMTEIIEQMHSFETTECWVKSFLNIVSGTL